MCVCLCWTEIMSVCVGEGERVGWSGHACLHACVMVSVCGGRWVGASM